AGKRAWAIDRTLWAARDFDSVDVVSRQIREIELAGESLIDGDSIEQDLHVLARQSAHENRRELSRRSGLNNRKTRNFSQGIRDPLDLLMIDVFRIDHADAGRRLIERNIETCRRDDDRLGFG